MFDNLMESNPSKQGQLARLFSGSSVSVVLHTGLIYFAIVMTMAGPEEAQDSSDRYHNDLHSGGA